MVQDPCKSTFLCSTQYWAWVHVLNYEPTLIIIQGKMHIVQVNITLCYLM